MNTKSIKTICLTIFIVLFVALPFSLSSQTTTIAVPATGSEKDSLICKETGRAPFFLFFDDKGAFLEAMKNPAKDQPGGISRTVAALLADKNVSMIIAESIGDKMKQALALHHIDFVIKTGTADSAVKDITQK